MNNLLILYPHGLGDCILLTPSIREFFNLTKNKVHVATLERFMSAKIFDNNPYVDKIFYTKDAWHDYPNSQIGFKSLYSEWKEKAKNLGFGGIVMPMHSSPINKIDLNFKYLGLKGMKNPKTEIHTTEEDRDIALSLISKIVGDNKFGFVQTKTGVPSKNLPEGFGKKWIKENKGIDNVIEIGTEIGALEYNINVQFEILRRASAVCLPDSVFYHACHAIGKEVDFVFFGRGAGIYNRVKPLWDVKENVVFKI